MKGIMVLFHCESNTGYAIGRLEPIFFQMALSLVGGDTAKIHFAYPAMDKGPSNTLPPEFNQYVVIDTKSQDPKHLDHIEQYVRAHNIEMLFGFDQPVSLPSYKYLRRGGVKKFISYWGAPMSSLFGPLKLALKKLEVSLQRNGPDLYIFESQGMAETAVYGRGIPARKVRVVYLSVDTEKFRPNATDANYVYDAFAIPKHRRIFFYSGHMEERKGVWVIMKTANYLAENRQNDDWHFLLTGNQPGEEKWLIDLLTPTARKHVTFGGYRNDIPRLHHGCLAGVIASSGWDSLTCSALEMQSSGLPLLISDLPGISESVCVGYSGYTFPSGSEVALGELAERLLDDDRLAKELSMNARNHALANFSISTQINNLLTVITA